MTQPTAKPDTPDLSPHSPAYLILKRASVLGLIDAEHLKPEIDRKARDQTLPQLLQLGWLKRLDTAGHLRADRLGRAPDTFALTEAGAAEARKLGFGHAHAYHQTRRANQAVDVLKLDVRRLAEQAHLRVDTERQILREPRIVQPDTTITWPDGRKVLFEIEGVADSQQRARILDKIVHWDEAAAALQAAGVDLQIRVIANVKSGGDFETFCTEWAQMLAVAQRSLGRQPALEFYAQPYRTFIEQPVWDNLDGFTRLDNPALVPEQFGPATPTTTLAPATDLLDLLPPPLRRRVAWDDLTLTSVRAHVLYFNEYLAATLPPLSTGFFELMRYLHATAYADQSGLARLAVPLAALFALRHYLVREPELKQALTVAYRRYRRASTIKVMLQFASELIDTFLDFHGLRHDSPEFAIWVQSPEHDYDSQQSRLSVAVDLNLPAEFWGALSPVEREQVSSDTADSLAWVLQQLLDYGPLLGLAGEDKKKSERKS